MPILHDINPRIIESLYCEALVLADELRAQIERSDAAQGAQGSAARPVRRPNREAEAELRVAVSCESLRATTRLMHCIAWLLNHRAYYQGEISRLQLRRHGRLIEGFPAGNAVSLSGFPQRLASLIQDSQTLYARILRLDRKWRKDGDERPVAVADDAMAKPAATPLAVHEFQSRISRSLA